MIDIVRSGKRAKTRFKKEPEMQTMNDIKIVVHFSNVIILKKIKNKLQSFKKLQKKWFKLDEKVMGLG